MGAAAPSPHLPTQRRQSAGLHGQFLLVGLGLLETARLCTFVSQSCGHYGNRSPAAQVERSSVRPHFRRSWTAASTSSGRAVCRTARHAAQLKSDYVGVTWHTNSHQWQAHVNVEDGRVPFSLGLFKGERDAAKAHDCARIALEGAAAKTNFPINEYTREDVSLIARLLKVSWHAKPSSKYHGVYQTAGSNKWKAEIEIYGLKQFLDFYDSELEAAKAVDHAIRSTGAERVLRLSMLNFREDDDYFNQDTWEDDRIPLGATSRFLGVTYHQPSGMYLAKRGRKHIGLFATEDEAAHAYDEAAHAAGSVTNFRVPNT